MEHSLQTAVSHPHLHQQPTSLSQYWAHTLKLSIAMGSAKAILMMVNYELWWPDFLPEP